MSMQVSSTITTYLLFCISLLLPLRFSLSFILPVPSLFFIRFPGHYQRFALQNKNKRMRTQAQDSDTRTNCYSPGCHTLHYTCSRSHDVISICLIFHQNSNRNTWCYYFHPPHFLYIYAHDFFRQCYLDCLQYILRACVSWEFNPRPCHC